MLSVVLRLVLAVDHAKHALPRDPWENRFDMLRVHGPESLKLLYGLGYNSWNCTGDLVMLELHDSEPLKSARWFRMLEFHDSELFVVWQGCWNVCQM